MGELGRLVPPFGGVKVCANADCRTPLEKVAFLFTDLDTGKLCVFCGECTLHVELIAHERFRLVPL